MKKSTIILIIIFLIVVGFLLWKYLLTFQGPSDLPPLIGGCAGVSLEYRQECCDNWANENNISVAQCVGNWTIEDNKCSWKCS